MANFGELLRRLRGERSQKVVAAELEMPVTTLSSLENQETVPRGAVLKRLADYYKVPLTYFYASAASAPQPSQPARDWLRSLQGRQFTKDVIATHAPAEYPDEVKQKFAATIRQKKKHGTTPNN